MNFSAVKENIQWDFCLEHEFRRPRKRGYTFVIDVLDEVQLALYYIRPHFSYSTTLDKQPPRHLLTRALLEQGYSPDREGLYPITPRVRSWIEENLF